MHGLAPACTNMSQLKNAARLMKDSTAKLKDAFQHLERVDVLVGVPSEKTEREDGAMNNASIAYIHDNGSPAQNIPARPFMRPGIERSKSAIAGFMKQAAKRVLTDNASKAEADLMKTGMTAQASIRNRINEGVPPPLKAGTLRGRIRNKTAVKGAKAELAAREAGALAGTSNAKPLVATGQLRNSINYVLRRK